MFELIFSVISFTGSVMPFVVICIIVIMIVKATRRHNNNDASSGTFKNTISNANDPNSYGNAISSESTNITCEYCGTIYNKLKKSCPSCGAKTNKK